jgi:hypothetical protein
VVVKNSLSNAYWVAACLAPSDVAPHPNFSVNSVGPAELLALVADLRARDREHYTEKGGSSLPGWLWSDGGPIHSDQDLVCAAEQSRSPNSQSASADALARYAVGPSATLGRRVAAALFASLAYAELDRLEDAIGVLSPLLSGNEFRPDTKSDALIEATVHQQLALRCVEASLFDDARLHAERVRSLLTNLPRGRWDHFPVSRGVSWRASVTQTNIAEQLSASAEGLLSSLDGVSSNSWQSVVRARAPHAELLQWRNLASGTTTWIDNDFSSQIAPLPGGRLYISEDPVGAPILRALVNAEFAGNYAQSQQRRAVLGRVYALEALQHPDQQERVELATESVRLLRSADDQKSLTSLLRHLRMSGPIASLREAALQVLNRPGIAKSIGRSDVLVIRHSADVLNGQELANAVSSVLAFGRGYRARQRPMQMQADWSVIRDLIRALQAVVPGSELDGMAASAALQLVPQQLRSNQLVGEALGGLAEVISWEKVDPATKSEWRRWAVKASDSVPSLRSALVLMEGHLATSGSINSDNVTDGLEYCAQMLDSRSAADVTEEELRRAESICSDMLRTIMSDAEQGSYSFGRYSAPGIAALLVAKFQANALWSPLTEYLTHLSVARSEKYAVMDRLATLAPPIPSETLEQLRRNWANTSMGFSDGPFDIGGVGSGAALRMGYRYHLVSEAELQSFAIRSAVRRDSDLRLEAVRSARIATSVDGYVEWAFLILLQLARDDSSSVAAQAMLALGALWPNVGHLKELVEQALTEGLDAPGMVVPLLTLRGLAAAEGSIAGKDLPEAIVTRIRVVAAKHESRAVRDAAADLVPGEEPPHDMR